MLFMTHKYCHGDFQLKVIEINDEFVYAKLALKDSSPFGHPFPLPPIL